MARSNYQYSKRQRELAKKQKREEKLQRKLERKQGGGGTVDETPESEQLEVSGEPEAAAEPASPELP
ncbi:MAG: hypothetical protein GX178_06735 [Acidobacteria bacterium]|nr:hypothetical protein [Thermoanaerobaculia bacterium]MDI9632346.1 hypothetical protein [Acidobacteriota bacterium]MBP7813752.1 hypothetical protein [Thermoanaerobaculia bacterium]MBP8845641.1 hypothetical protein [Thermoanaerobaculia bacterium]NLN11286.1 hypothetical protein [Acidobacteriota bacterium]